MRDVLTDVDAWTARGDKVALAMVVASSARRRARRARRWRSARAARSSGAVSRRLRRGRGRRGRRGGPERRRAAAAALRHRRRGGVGRRAAVRRRDRRLGGALRAVSELSRRGASPQHRPRTDGRGALVTILEGPSPGAQAARRARRDAPRHARRRRSSTTRPRRHADELMWAERSERASEGDVLLFVDVVVPPPRLIIFGAGRLRGAALHARARRAAGGRTSSTRAAFFARPERFPDAEEVVAAWPEEAFAALGGIDRATSIAVLTHDPKLDDAALEIALRSEAAYIGAMGSRRAQEKRRERLLAQGHHRRGARAAVARRSASTSARSRPRRRRCRSWARSSRCATAAPGGRLANARGRIHEVTGEVTA